jgi:hypothetical protein
MRPGPQLAVATRRPHLAPRVPYTPTPATRIPLPHRHIPHLVQSDTTASRIIILTFLSFGMLVIIIANFPPKPTLVVSRFSLS